MIEVAAGVITDAEGCVLLMQRLPGKHLAGLWEFPGGKLEPGESIVQALVRELREEVGIEVVASEPLISIPWRYPEKSVRLHACRVTTWTGKPEPREGHALRWIALRDMDIATMPAADAPIVSALRLPPYYVIGGKLETAEAGSGSLFKPIPRRPSACMKTEPDPISTGLVQLRMPDAPRDIVRRVAIDWLAVEPSLRARLLVNHDIELAHELGIGVHLRASQLRELPARPLPSGAWVAASCHDAGELELAARLGVDFATLSPVCVTASHPRVVPLGWDSFARLANDARLPVYALGGVGLADLGRARAAGAQGIAGIRAFRAVHDRL